MLINRFSDAAVEREFRRWYRRSSRATTRVLIIVSAAVIVAGLLAFPKYEVISVKGQHVTAVFCLLLLGVSYWLVERKIYVDHSWFDLIISTLVFLGVAVLWAGSNISLGEAVEVSNLTAAQKIALLEANRSSFIAMGLVAVIASFLFAGSVTLFLVFLVVHVVGSYWDSDMGGKLPAGTVIRDSWSFVALVAIAAYNNWARDFSARKAFAAQRELHDQREKAAELLYKVLPQTAAVRVQAGEQVADSFSNVTVIFVDMVGFSKLSKSLTPGHLVEILNRFFSAADDCADRHGIEKVKTIGDAYLAVAGGIASREATSLGALHFAQDLIKEVESIAADVGLPVAIRTGIHTGPVVGGVIGSRRLAYDYWGDTVNIAARLQGAAPINGIAVSETTYFQTKGSQAFHGPRAIPLQGVGEVSVYEIR